MLDAGAAVQAAHALKQEPAATTGYLLLPSITLLCPLLLSYDPMILVFTRLFKKLKYFPVFSSVFPIFLRLSWQINHITYQLVIPF